jgi:ubiquinone/menaquinone biosynthesis C-methylase UbiE
MTQMTNFTQADTSPAFFIEFLEFLDTYPSIKALRNQSNRSLNISAGHKVLDLGCGIGGATLPIAEITGPTGLAVGVDLSSAMIDYAARRTANRREIEFRLGDACSVPYPDKFFDVARSERLFLYLPDRLAAIKEMMRVVKPGGCVCVLDTDIDSTAVYSRNPARMRKMTSIVAASMPNPTSARDLPALARQAGLKDLKIDLHAIATPHEFFLRSITGSLMKAVEDGVVPRAEVDDCLAEQAALHASGDFFQMWMFVHVSGTV